MPNDIEINAGLGRSTATGPGAPALPDLEMRDYLTPFQSGYYPRMGRGRGGGGGGLYQPLRAGKGYSYSRPNVGVGSGSPNAAPSVQQVPQQSEVPTYVKMMHGPGIIGGYRPATANEPGAVFAGYKPAAGMPDQVSVAPMPQSSPAEASGFPPGMYGQVPTPAPTPEQTAAGQLMRLQKQLPGVFEQYYGRS